MCWGSRFFSRFFLFWSLSGQDIGKTTVGNWGWSRQAQDEEEWEGEEDEKKAQKGLLVVLNKLDLHEARRYIFAFCFFGFPSCGVYIFLLTDCVT